MSTGYISFKKDIGNIISVLRYTIKKLEFFEDTNFDNDSALKGVVKLYNDNGSTEYSEFIYNGCIVSIYGALERLIEDLLEEYIVKTNSIVKEYSELNSQIIKNHVEFSFSFASRIGKDRNLESAKKLKKQKEIVKNLQSCFALDSDYTLNKRAFSSHTANFRFDIIREAFSNIGVPEILFGVVKLDDLKSTLMKDLGLNANESVENKQLELKLKSRLDELAQRRNEIAHGSKPESYLSYALLLQLSELISSFGKSLEVYCCDSIDRLKFKNINFNPDLYLKITTPKVLKQVNVMGFDITDNEGFLGKKITVGMEVYLVNINSKEKVIKSYIKSLSVNKNIVDSYTITGQFSLGLVLDISICSSFEKRDVYINTDFLSL